MKSEQGHIGTLVAELWLSVEEVISTSGDIAPST